MSTSSSSTPRHTNRLAREKSPYLLQHAHNPVDWYPWGQEAFDKARRENKPIFLSIGYSTCHWCHVMERESFEDEAVARFLNEHFVSIKVDREERPDVDQIYMSFVQAMTGQGGWPLNVFLTPDLKPFYGGTYWPPEPRFGRPSFLQVAQQVAKAWRERGRQLTASADEMHRRMMELAQRRPAKGVSLDADLLRQAAVALKQGYDAEHGGWGHAPKFPSPAQPAFLLRYAARYGDTEAVRMVLHTCRRMARGGIHDQIGGGFHRYSVDEKWLVPHFEKMLYDNAQLAGLYLDAYLVSGDRAYAEVARDTLEYVLRDMTHPQGGFYSAEDADSEGKEGKFYCWTLEELKQVLTPEETRVAVEYFGVTEQGNFVDHSDPDPLPHLNVLSIVKPELEQSQARVLRSVREKLFRARAKRVRPHRDDKILASWNGLMLGALARAYAVLGDDTWREAAEKNLAFLQDHLWEPSSQTLHHRWRDGERDRAQLLEDYAYLLNGVIALYEATLEPRHLQFAVDLAEGMLQRFYDKEHGGFWQSAGHDNELILRVKDDYDGAVPSGNSMAALALLKLATLTDHKPFREAADKTLRLFADRLQQIPQALPAMLSALTFAVEEPYRVVVAAEDPSAPEARKLIRAAASVFQPHKVILGTREPVEPFARTLKPREGRPVVYLCTGTACQPPTSDPARIKTMLKPLRARLSEHPGAESGAGE